MKMLEDVPESKLAEYLGELTDENAKEIFEDEEMVNTAEEFLQSSLNVSETSRNLYMHRNTLLYRLDKIEKATGLNIRRFPTQFPSASSPFCINFWKNSASRQVFKSPPNYV